MADASTPTTPSPDAAPRRRRRNRQPRRVYVVAGVASLVLAAVGAFVGREIAPQPHPSTVAVEPLKRDAGDAIVRPERLEIPR